MLIMQASAASALGSAIRRRHRLSIPAHDRPHDSLTHFQIIRLDSIAVSFLFFDHWTDMAATTTPDDSDLDVLSPLDVIFNCGVCHDSIRDAYHTKEDIKGSGSDQIPDRSAVDRFWMTECGHLICWKHVPPAILSQQSGKQPHTTCPECEATKQDACLKKFFPIRGYAQDERDPAIPEAFFQCPPAALMDENTDDLRVSLSSPQA